MGIFDFSASRTNLPAIWDINFALSENFTVLITERLISDYELFFKTNYTF